MVFSMIPSRHLIGDNWKWPKYGTKETSDPSLRTDVPEATETAFSSDNEGRHELIVDGWHALTMPTKCKWCKNVFPPYSRDIIRQHFELAHPYRALLPSSLEALHTEPVNLPAPFVREHGAKKEAACMLPKHEVIPWVAANAGDGNTSSHNASASASNISSSLPRSFFRKEATPFPDSGYSSAPTGARIMPSMVTINHLKKTGMETTEEHVEPNDDTTMISAAETLLNNFTMQPIADVCKDIHDKLADHFNSKDWSFVSRDIRRLIKTFSLKMGFDSTNALNPRIMHFTYKYHEEIATKLQEMFSPDHEGDSKRPGQSQPGMSLHDKLELWESNCLQTRPSVDSYELFEGVEDFNDDETFQHEYVSYSQAIIESKPYEWLISSLLKSISFYRDEFRPREDIEDVRDIMLKRLPTGRISSRREPDILKVSFTFQWAFLEHGLKATSMRTMMSMGQVLATTVVLTCSAMDQIQATTVEEYLNQVWASDGTQLLGVLVEAINGKRGELHSVSLPGKSEIGVVINGVELVVDATGPSYSIAERAEQLAWLAAALKPAIRSDGNLFTRSTVYENASKRQAPSGTQYNDRWTIASYHDESVTRRENSLLFPKIAKITSTCVARGYPTIKRPNNIPGVEITMDTLYNLLVSPSLTGTSPTIILEGTRMTFRLIKRVGNFLLWHVSRLDDHVCDCQINEMPSRALGLKELRSYRHLISDCDATEVVSDSDRALEVNSCHSAEGFNGSLEEKTSHYTDDSAISETPGGTPHSAAVSGSLDTEMLSISASPELADERTACLGGNDDRMIESIARRLILEYFASDHRTSSSPEDTMDDTRPESNEAGDTSNSRPTASNSLSAEESNMTQQRSQRTCKKRSRLERDKDGSDDEELPRFPPKKQNSHKTNTHRKTLACPFWKRSPSEHRGCFLKKLDKISRVKQHLVRNHTRIYCRRCLAVFENDRLLTAHAMRESSCVVNVSTDVENISISYEKQKALSKKSRPGSESEKWFDVWEILFRGVSRPASPYLDLEYSQDHSEFREYVQANGRNVIMDEIRRDPTLSSFVNSSSETEAALEQVMNRALDLMMRWPEYNLPSPLSTRTSTSAPSRTSALPEGMLLEQSRSPPSTFADSAVGLISQVPRSTPLGSGSRHAEGRSTTSGPQPNLSLSENHGAIQLGNTTMLSENQGEPLGGISPPPFDRVFDDMNLYQPQSARDLNFINEPQDLDFGMFDGMLGENLWHPPQDSPFYGGRELDEDWLTAARPEEDAEDRW
ncbi:hypothetical protein F4778DRAFT_794098 [Xylariomycetidae sp. FL2044]|nr:hypothetical protein F4778DRAFT_794098 [Xylariomycetidae sp. FL2044]